MSRIALMVAATLATFAVAVAQAPGTSAQTSSTSETAPPPVETATPSTPPAQTRPATATAPDEVDREFARISHGWKPTQRGKATLYCRFETSLGTRVGRNVCLTRQQLYDRARAGQEARDRMAKPNQCTGSCTTGS
jgi:hypothetical protein